jgi:hypothetical protein
MGWYWSMGISFKEKQIAEKCQERLLDIKLSDNRVVQLKSHILLQTDFNLKPDFVLEIFPERMEIDGDRKNLEYPYFIEIKIQLLQFIKELDLKFEISFFEFEGADRVTNENIIKWINNDGIGDILVKDYNNLYSDSKYYTPKRYLDGLILSMEQHDLILNKIPEFINFKDGYVWLPISK